MNRLVAIAVALSPSIASAEFIGGDIVTAGRHNTHYTPAGALCAWFAGTIGALYIGGEIGIDQLTGGKYLGVTYHALVGVTRRTGPVRLLFDAGVGVTQQVAIDIFGGSTSTAAVLPSGALRAQAVIDIGNWGGAVWGLGLEGETRSTFESSPSYGAAVGLALVASK